MKEVKNIIICKSSELLDKIKEIYKNKEEN